MATITANRIGESLGALTVSSAAGGGDEIDPAGATQLLLGFRNGHTAAQTVTIVAQTTSFNIPGYGAGTKGNLSLAVTENGGEAFCHIKNISPYLNANGRVALSYSGVTALTLTAAGLK